jgi:putative addiction module component (TIGR02574 family)
MNATTDEVVPQDLIERAMALSTSARRRLAELLLGQPEPVPFEISPEWREEILRRVEAVRNGTMPTISAEESIARLRRYAAEGTRE